MKSIPLTTIYGFLGYTIRPVCLYFFILMSYEKPSRTFLTFSWIPLVVNFLIFCLAFIPATKDYVFCYFLEGGVIIFGGGYLRFASHIIPYCLGGDEFLVLINKRTEEDNCSNRKVQKRHS